MPSSISHAVVAVVLGSALAPRPLLRPFLVVGAGCAVLPDIDAIGRILNDGPGDIEWLGGHRGFTHSIAGAVLTGTLAALATRPSAAWQGSRLRFATFITIATAAHGALDAWTSIGAETSPVQFFSPFSTRGYTAPWHPIDGPFSEVFLCIVPLLAITRLICHYRGFGWPRWRDTRVIELQVGRGVDERE